MAGHTALKAGANREINNNQGAGNNNMIFITGDTHRDFSRLRLLDLQGGDLVIVLGDAGVNYYLDSSDVELKKELSELPCEFFFLRGNHEARPENISSYERETVSGIVSGEVYREPEFPTLMFAAEGLYTIGGHRCFVTNGAYSVDQHYRVRGGMPWFADEELSDEEMRETLEKAKAAGQVEFVLSHTCPLRYIPTDEFLPFIDQSTVSKRMEEFLDKLADVIDYERWYCGHYHTERTIDKIWFLYKDILEFGE